MEAHSNIYKYLFILNVIRREYPSWRRTLLSSSWFWQGERGCWSSSRYFSNIVQIFFKCLSNIFKCLTKAEYQIFNLFIFSNSIHPSPVHERGWKYPQWYWRRFYPWVLHRKMWRWWQPPSRSSFLGLPWWYILASLHPCSCSCIFAMMVNTLETFTITMYMNYMLYYFLAGRIFHNISTQMCTNLELRKESQRFHTPFKS